MNLVIENRNYKGPVIYCIWSDEDDKNRMYFGQTINYNKRLTNHKNMLKRKVHPNIYLQHMSDKNYILKAAIVEDCNLEHLCNREKFWIDFFNTTDSIKGFNLEQGGKINNRSGISGTLKGRKQSQEWIDNRAKANRGQKRNYTPEHILAIKTAMTNNLGTRHKGKSVKVTDTITGLVTIFDSKRSVEDFLGFQRDKLIHKFYYGRPRKILNEIKYNNYLIER